MNISKNPRVFEIDQCHIHHKARKMGGMKEVEVGVLDPSTIEIGGWIGFRLKWSGILLLVLSSSSNQISVFFRRAKTNILGYFGLSLVIDENKGVVSRVASIKESPPFTRVHRVVEFVTQWWVNGNGGWTASFRNGGIIPSTQRLRWVALDAIVIQELLYFS